VHLAGKTDRGDGIGGETRGLQRFANGQRGGAPPVARILFGPAGLGTGEIGVLFRAGSEDCAAFIDDDGARAAGTDVNTENWNTASFLRKT